MTRLNRLTTLSVFRLACSTRVSRVRCGVSPHRVAREKVQTVESAGAPTWFQAGRRKRPARHGCYNMHLDRLRQ